MYMLESKQQARGNWKGREAHQQSIELINKAIFSGLQEHILAHHCDLGRNTTFCFSYALNYILS